MLTHQDVWRAIDALAQMNGLSASGLARKAGLCPTSFNPSKRTNGQRKRWPSTESLASILRATNCSLDDFVALASPQTRQNVRLPVLSGARAAEKGFFDEKGLPLRKNWDERPLPAAEDPHAFAIELDDERFAPEFPEGTLVVLSPAQTLRRGDWAALMTVSGELWLKKLGASGAQKLELLSNASDEPPVAFARKEILWIYRIVWASK